GRALALLRAAAHAGDPYRLVICDMQMPGMDGAALAQAIRADASLDDAILVLLSSLGHLAGAGDAKRLFAVRLTKPIREAQLVEGLVTALAASRRKRQPPAARGTARRLPGRRRILLGEDDADNRLTALHILLAKWLGPLAARKGRTPAMSRRTEDGAVR